MKAKKVSKKGSKKSSANKVKIKPHKRSSPARSMEIPPKKPNKPKKEKK